MDTAGLECKSNGMLVKLRGVFFGGGGSVGSVGNISRGSLQKYRHKLLWVFFLN
jgi:hypothetical protein